MAAIMCSNGALEERSPWKRKLRFGLPGLPDTGRLVRSNGAR